MVKNFIHQMEVLSTLRNLAHEEFSSNEPEEVEKLYTAILFLDRLEQNIIDDFKRDFENDEEAR